MSLQKVLEAPIGPLAAKHVSNVFIVLRQIPRGKIERQLVTEIEIAFVRNRQVPGDWVIEITACRVARI